MIITSIVGIMVFVMIVPTGQSGYTRTVKTKVKVQIPPTPQSIFIPALSGSSPPTVASIGHDDVNVGDLGAIFGAEYDADRDGEVKALPGYFGSTDPNKECQKLLDEFAALKSADAKQTRQLKQKIAEECNRYIDPDEIKEQLKFWNYTLEQIMVKKFVRQIDNLIEK